MRFGLPILSVLVSVCLSIISGCKPEPIDRDEIVVSKSGSDRNEPNSQALIEPILLPIEPVVPPILYPLMLPRTGGGGGGRHRQAACPTDNECTVLISEARKACEYQLNPDKECFGSCTPSDNCNCPRNINGECPNACIIDPCKVGRCVEQDSINGGQNTFTCLSANKVDLPPDNPQSCNDNNECTTNGCQVNLQDGLKVATCTSTPINDPTVLCNVDKNQCTTGHCVAGQCDVTTGAIVIPDVCNTDEDCARGEGLPPLTCVDPPGICSIIGRPCNTTSDCTGQTCFDRGDGARCSVTGQPCASQIDCPGFACFKRLPYCACDDGNACTSNDSCGQGSCQGSNLPNTCDSDSDCGTGGHCFSSAGTCEIPMALSVNDKSRTIGAPCNTTAECGVDEICNTDNPQSFCTCQKEDTCGNESGCDTDMCIDGTCEDALTQEVCVASGI
jgi:hypothetical protein